MAAAPKAKSKAGEARGKEKTDSAANETNQRHGPKPAKASKKPALDPITPEKPKKARKNAPDTKYAEVPEGFGDSSVHDMPAKTKGEMPSPSPNTKPKKKAKQAPRKPEAPPARDERGPFAENK